MTSRCKAPTMLWSRCSRSSTAIGATASSRPGPTSSPCSKRPSSYAGGRGRDASCRSSRRRGHSSPTGTRLRRPSAERSELFDELQKAISDELTPHQREVLVATTLNGVPIDVLAERLNTTRGALYKTLHDARHKLRVYLAARGMSIGEEGKEEA